MKNQLTTNQTSAKSEIVVYQPNETMRLEVQLRDENIWLSQQRIDKVYTYGANSPKLAPAVANYVKEYPLMPIEIKNYKQSHDRFLIVDNTVWHIGASLKDAGSAAASPISFRSIAPVYVERF